MTIRVGSGEIAGVRVGTTPAAAVHVGSQQVWPVGGGAGWQPFGTFDTRLRKEGAGGGADVVMRTAATVGDVFRWDVRNRPEIDLAVVPVGTPIRMDMTDGGLLLARCYTTWQWSTYFAELPYTPADFAVWDSLAGTAAVYTFTFYQEVTP